MRVGDPPGFEAPTDVKNRGISGPSKGLMSSNMDCWSVSHSFEWNVEPLAKYPTINYTCFGCNNMAFFDY